MLWPSPLLKVTIRIHSLVKTKKTALSFYQKMSYVRSFKYKNIWRVLVGRTVEYDCSYESLKFKHVCACVVGIVEDLIPFAVVLVSVY